MHTFLYARVSTTDQTTSHQRAQAEAAGTKYRGRKPTFDVEQLHRTRDLLSMGMSPSAIDAEVGIPRATVYRIKENPAKAVTLLETWGIS